MTRPVHWFDGHLDLTYIALHGRDLSRPAEQCGGTLQPATVTFPALAAGGSGGGVTRAVSTIFVRERRAGGVEGDFCFSNETEAFNAAMWQVDMHRVWESEGLIEIQKLKTQNSKLKTGGGEGEKRDTTDDIKIKNQKSKIKNPPLRVVLAIEGAACLRRVEDAEIFFQAGVRMVSLAWAEGSKWAGGDRSGGGGGGDLTAAGNLLLRRLDELGIVHDVSHLSERAFWSVMELAAGPVVASHSNCRGLLAGAGAGGGPNSPERHLSDEQIRAIASRPEGVIGVNLYAKFLLPAEELAQRRATSADVIRHLEHMAQVAGRRDFLALGSDMDSGFGADLLPADLQGPGQLDRLAAGLSAAGWSDAEIDHFANRWAQLPGLDI